MADDEETESEQGRGAAAPGHSQSQVALIMCADLMFSVRLQNMAKKAGYVAAVIRPGAPLPSGEVLVVDLAGRGDWEEAMRQATLQQIPVVAFGPHMESAGRRRAKAAGATRVLANSNLERDLPGILAELIKHRPVARAGEEIK